VWVQLPVAYAAAYLLLALVGVAAAMHASLKRDDPRSADWRVAAGIFYLVGIPTFDFVTDTLYLLSDVFANVPLFALMLLFICAPALLFLRALHALGASPRWYLLQPPAHVYPVRLDALVRVDGRSLVLVVVTLAESGLRVLLAVAKLAPWLLANAATLLPLRQSLCCTWNSVQRKMRTP
jgi:hypothetical protein